MFYAKGIFKNFSKFTGKNLCQSFFLEKLQAVAWNVFKKETLGQVFSCECCEILKNTFFYRAPLVAAPDQHKHQKYHIIPQALYHTFIETLGQLFCCEYCEISKNTLFYRAPLVAAPEQHKHHKYWLRTHSFLLLLFLTLNFFASWGINSIYSRWRFPFTCFSFQFSLCLVQFIGVSIAR